MDKRKILSKSFVLKDKNEFDDCLMTDRIKFLEDRVAELEQALIDAELPFDKKECNCCKNFYIPSCYDDSCRCSKCWNCYYDKKVVGKWVRHQNCPSKKS